MDQGNYKIVWLLIAATLPLVVSIFSTFTRQAKAKDVEGYFLFDRKLSIEGFLRTTIGYSLQVASIYLFFTWTVSYGAYALIVCVAWTVGYWLISYCVRFGIFDHFLAIDNTNERDRIATIHGFVAARLAGNSRQLKRITMLLLAGASLIGLGGTMLTEITYSTIFFAGSLGVHQAAVPPQFLYTVVATILAFTTFYVLWGGYTSVVATERFQVPLAYVGYGLFTFGIAAAGVVATSYPTATRGSIFVSGVIFCIALLILLRNRIYLFRQVNDLTGKITAWLTFGPLLIAFLTFAALSIPLLAVVWHSGALVSVGKEFIQTAIPTTGQPFGFGSWGVIALIVANAIWQFIDVSSLQRLQSIDYEDVKARREMVVKALRITGSEAGIGWAILVATALIFRFLGVTDVDHLFAHLDSLDGSAVRWTAFLTPILIFTVTVYMLSTISAIISATSYIAHYDIADALGLRAGDDERNKLRELNIARVITVLVVFFIFVGFVVLRSLVGDRIDAVLYAVYAFQLAITPGVLVALLFGKARINPIAAIASTSLGLLIAYLTATGGPEIVASVITIDATSWFVIPPLAVVVVTIPTYLVIALITSPLFAKRKGA